MQQFVADALLTSPFRQMEQYTQDPGDMTNAHVSSLLLYKTSAPHCIIYIKSCMYTYSTYNIKNRVEIENGRKRTAKLRIEKVSYYGGDSFRLGYVNVMRAFDFNETEALGFCFERFNLL